MAVAGLVVVAVLVAVVAPLALARRRRPPSDPHARVWTAARRPAWLATPVAGSTPSEHLSPPPSPRDAPAPPPRDAPIPPPRRDAPLPHDDAPPPTHCDWELRLAAGDQLSVLRPARQQVCCVHTLSLAWPDLPPRGQRTDRVLTWSGDRTRTHDTGTTSSTRRQVTTTDGVSRGPGVVARTAVVWEPGPEVTTPWQAADPDDGAGRPAAARLWTAHTRTLRRRGARARPDPPTSVAAVDVLDRLHVRVDVARGCPGGAHQLDARARTAVEVVGTAWGTARADCRVPAVAAWTSGDLEAAATTTTRVEPGTTVLPLDAATVLPVPAVRSRAVAVVGDAAPADVGASLVGEAAGRTDEGGFEVVLGGLARAELAVDPADDLADARLEVAVHHRLAVVVEPAEVADAADAPCACRPRWSLHLGDAVGDVPTTAPLGRVVVDGAQLTLHRATGPAPPGSVWALRHP